MRDEWHDTDLLTASDLAKYLGVTSTDTIDRMVEDRTCPRPTMLGKQKRWRWGVIRRWQEAVEFLQAHGLQIEPPQNAANDRKTEQNTANGYSDQNEDCDRPKKR